MWLFIIFPILAIDIENLLFDSNLDALLQT